MTIHGVPAMVTGRLGLDDMARHVPVLVQVPGGIEALHITFDHRPRHPGAGAIAHQLSISVTAPDGPRGTRHNHADQDVLLSATRASPGYLPGPITPGLWRIEIDTHRILPPGGIDWRIGVTGAKAPDGAGRPATQPFPVRPGPGWYRGDLHRHTLHSDARWSAAEMVADAVARGYDFAALTDHNTVSALPEALDAAGADLLILPGMEMTTFHGHALVLGSGAMIDWRIRDGQTMAGRAGAVMASGDLFVIAHPMSLGHPHCTGCTWAWADMFPGPARLVEVWNGPWSQAGWPKNPLALDLFHGWLNAGHRLVATAGSDDHGHHGPQARPGHMLVHAEALSVPGLLAGVSRGHAVLTGGPVLRVSGSPGAAPLMPGDGVAAPVNLHVQWQGAVGGGRLRLIAGRRGEDAARLVHDSPAGAEGSILLPATTYAAACWAMVELRDAGGGMQALANPIFVGDWTRPRQQPHA